MVRRFGVEHLSSDGIRREGDERASEREWQGSWVSVTNCIWPDSFRPNEKLRIALRSSLPQVHRFPYQQDNNYSCDIYPKQLLALFL